MGSDLFSKRDIEFLFKNRGIQPSRGLGQNFLIDKTAVKKIITACDLQPNDLILEIGPGPGVLTQELAKGAKKVIAVEKDPKMIEVLRENLRDHNNVEVIRADVRKLKPRITNYKLVGNLPFYLVAPIIRKFLELPKDHSPRFMVLVTQKEVAQRICAKPPDMNLLAVSVQIYAKPKIVSYISRKSFWPQPEVDAATIKVMPQINPDKLNQEKVSVDLFFKIVKAGFSQPRKQLINNLSDGLKIDKIRIKTWLLENNIQPQQRAEVLDIKDWIKLTKKFK